jgi:hypothetical protein
MPKTIADNWINPRGAMCDLLPAHRFRVVRVDRLSLAAGLIHAHHTKAVRIKSKKIRSVIRSTPEPCPRSIDCQVGVGVVARFIKLGQLGAVSLAQFTILNAPVDQPAKAVVQ